MVKSDRRRKQDRAKRRAAAAQRRSAVQRRHLRDEAIREAERRMAMLRDPGTPVEMVAALIAEMYAGEPVMPRLGRLLCEYRGSVDEVTAVGDALSARAAQAAEEPSLTVLTFRAQAAHLVQDHALACRLMDKALAVADEPELRLRLVTHLRFLGRIADAVNLLASHVADPAYDSSAAVTHQAALEDAQRHLGGEAPQGACTCGSGQDWFECCRAREAAAVERFLDRSRLYALRTAVAQYLPGSPYEGPVAKHVAEWLDLADAESWDHGDRDPLERLAIEHAWVAASVNPVADDDEDNVLTVLVADPATAPEIAAAARVWRDHLRYGLWQVADPTTAPGLWCTELVTGQEFYVAFAPEQTERLPRWGVLLGAIVPLDGAWRATGSLIRLSPSEADAFVETIKAAVEVVVGELGGRLDKRAQRRLRQPVPFGRAEPHNVYAHAQEPAPQEVGMLIGGVIGSLLPRLVAELHDWRAVPPMLTNTDGDPLRLIKARVRIRDAAAVVAQLGRHPDFEADSDDGNRLSWLGREVPARQRAAMLAEARAQLQATGHSEADLALPDGPNRWVRGQLHLEGNELVVEVNSRERLQRLLAVLDTVGAEPAVVDQSYVDPMQDLPWPAGHRPLRGGLASPDVGWEQQWLDEPVPALRGLTPRQAAGSDDWPLLEGMLREMEYDGDLLAHRGERGPDASWLRDQLGMPADWWT